MNKKRYVVINSCSECPYLANEKDFCYLVNDRIKESYGNVYKEIIFDCGLPLLKEGEPVNSWDHFPVDTSIEEAVNSPSHYNQVPDIECIEVAKHFNFCLGNAIKYIWRCNEKGKKIEDLKKAIWYLEKEISEVQNEKA